MAYDIYIRKRGEIFLGEVPVLPGCYTLGRTEKEVIDNVRDMIEGSYRMLRKKNQPRPKVKMVRIRENRFEGSRHLKKVEPGLKAVLEKKS